MTIRPSKRPTELTKARAKELRLNASEPEVLLWDAFRARKLAGLKFRRQHPIEPYIADFYCAAARLVIELDGRSHDDQQEHDKIRDRFFNSLGLMTIRIHNDDVLSNLDGVLEFIATVATPRLQPPLDV
jgi:very-short-patch-repair endonuclease